MKKNIHNLSLGFRTEMIFHRFDGIIVDRGDYLVVKTPSNPGYMFGNLILFFDAPRNGCLDEWKAVFQREFGENADIKHFTFLWDDPSIGAGEIKELKAAGFKVDFSVVLKANAVQTPRKYNHEIKVRPIGRGEWHEVTEMQILSKSSEFEETSYRTFKERQMARYRTMTEKGLGLWFGAFLGNRLVGDLGVYREGHLGRFQSVETHPDFRRQGVCGTLVYESSIYALNHMGIEELVMVADEDYHAAKIYESVGFSPVAKEYSAFWWDKNYRG